MKNNIEKASSGEKSELKKICGTWAQYDRRWTRTTSRESGMTTTSTSRRARKSTTGERKICTSFPMQTSPTPLANLQTPNADPNLEARRPRARKDQRRKRRCKRAMMRTRRRWMYETRLHLSGRNVRSRWGVDGRTSSKSWNWQERHHWWLRSPFSSQTQPCHSGSKAETCCCMVGAWEEFAAFGGEGTEKGLSLD